jgi:rod shape-determining protein MreC
MTARGRRSADGGLTRARGLRSDPDGLAPKGGNRLLLILLVVTATVLISVDARLGEGSPLEAARETVASAVAPVQNALGALAQPVRDLAAHGEAARDERVVRLEAELDRLRAEVRTTDVDRDRAAELDALLGVVSAGQYPTVPAQVVAVSSSQLSERTVTIDAGTADGVAVDMTVLNGDGLVGRVLAVTASTATVQLVIDSAARVGVRLAGSAQLGLARGGTLHDGQDALGFELLDPLEPMADGDVVVTFGSPGGRPFVPGVPVGVLRAVDGAYGATPRTAALVPYVDFSALDLVGVVLAPPRTDPRDLLVPTTAAGPSAPAIVAP